jgi:hypothetical protein
MPRVPQTRSEPRATFDRAPDSPDPTEVRRRYDTRARPLAAAFSGEHAAAGRPNDRRYPQSDPFATARFPVARRGDGAWQAGDDWETNASWNDAEDWGDEDEVPAARAPAPALARYRASSPGARRGRVATHALLQHVHNPLARARIILAIMAIVGAVGFSVVAAGESRSPAASLHAGASSRAALIVAQAVRPLTSLLRPDQYDSKAQFQLYSGAACSPSVLAEVLTAWGIPNATIGHMIDDLGPTYLSPNWGLLDEKGFQFAAAKHHMRADISWHLTYNQILYVANVLGLPVIVNFRRSYGYYSYFAGGHFLVVTSGDQQGVTIVDSSEYFIKYLTKDVFDGLWEWRGDGTAMTVVIVPEGYRYTLPNV